MKNSSNYNGSKAIPHIVGSYVDTDYLLKCTCHEHPLNSYSNEEAADKSIPYFKQQGHVGVYVDQKSTVLNIVEDY